MLVSRRSCFPAGTLLMALSIWTTGLMADEPTPSFPLGPELQNVPLEDLEKAYEGKTAPEGIRMYMAIMKGSQMGPGDGWFGPSQSRYSWDWLCQKCGVEDASAGIKRESFPGMDDAFERLDRNRDGTITRFDLDWSDGNPWVEHAYLANRLFRQMNSTGDGRLTREQWIAFYDAAANGKEALSMSELRRHWLTGLGGSFLPGDAPSKETLLRGLFSGEIGSLHEGPALDAPAPDFHLKSPDESTSVRLSERIGSKPVVLVFGNFTCGPFRSMYVEVDEIARRYRDQAVFLGVYVREAHPTDGWSMQSNERVGVSVAQPKTFAERSTVAQKCFVRLKPSFPWMVDDVDDATGNAYSGMPARLYVLDSAGKVAYKGGRGPFGFKPGEMEQALLMTLVDSAPRAVAE